MHLDLSLRPTRVLAAIALATALSGCPSAEPAYVPDAGDAVSADTGTPDGSEDIGGSDVSADGDDGGALDQGTSDGAAEDTGAGAPSEPVRIFPAAGGGSLRSEVYHLQLTVGAPVQASELRGEHHRALLGVSTPIRNTP
jgi:hypothetical protein